MKKFFITLLVILLVLAVLAGVGGFAVYNYLYQDFTGVPYEEILAYQAENPKVNITYTVTISGGDSLIELDNNTQSVTLDSENQFESLIAQAEYLQKVVSIDLGNTAPRPAETDALKAAFPNADIQYRYVTILDEAYPVDTTDFDLSSMTADQIEYVVSELKGLPNLQTVNLLDADGNAKLTLDEVVQLYTALPNVNYTYAVELYGQRLTTDMETVEYFQVYIGDQGLEEFKKLLPIMHGLTYFKLDWCETSDEAMDALRTEYADDFKVVWRVFFGEHFNLLTDSYRLWANQTLRDHNIDKLNYFHEVKYLDLGHNFFTHVNFLNNMPDVETCIIACGKLEDISALANCQKITYLELLDNHQLDNEDLQVLTQLPNLEHLNVSNMTKVTDLSFTDGMTNLKRLWCTQFRGTNEELNRVKALHPDTETMLTKGGEAVSHGWRKLADGTRSVTYALISAQFDYDHWQFARYPLGYLRDEITYESLGLTPP